MSNKEILIKEIESLPEGLIDEVCHYVYFLKQYKFKVMPNDITLASEQVLAKDWLLEEEDLAWENL